MYNLVKAFSESLKRNAIPTSIDFLENEIDSLISDDNLRNVPILNTIVAVIRTGRDLHERNLLKQTFAFLSEFNSGKINEEKLQKYKNGLDNDKGKLQELERVLLILNKNIDIEKSKILAKLFIAYVNEQISWDMFCEYVDINDRFFIEDYRVLEGIWMGKELSPKEGDKFRVERIYSTGIIGNSFTSLMAGEQGLGGRVLNKIGKTFCEIIFNRETS